MPPPVWTVAEKKKFRLHHFAGYDNNTRQIEFV